jgi:hypothetical protein
MTQNKNFGRLLEDEMFKSIKALGMFDIILTEDDLIRMYGWQSSSIDLMLQSKEHIIFIQLKWRRSRRRENKGIDNFVRSVEHVSGCLGNKYTFGVWVSRRDPFDDNKCLLMNRKIYTVHEFENIENLVKKAEQFLVSKVCA